MRKLYKTIAVVLVIALFYTVACVSFDAATIIENNGFLYSAASATTAYLHGRETNNADLVIPKEFNDHYVVNIADSAFVGDKYIESLSFGEAILLERIGYYAFMNCKNLSGTVYFPGRISTLGVSAFQGCSALEGVVFNSYISNISDQSFYNCSSLNTVMLNSNVEKIGKFAFANCSSLKYVEIPKSLTSIDSTAFEGDVDIVLGVYKDSYALRYAEENEIDYIILDGVKLGDADGDGSVNVSDVTRVQRYLAELETLEGIYLHAADANQDGTVDISDATALQMYIAEYDLPYPIGEVMTQ